MAWRVALGLLVLKIVKWLVLFLTLGGAVDGLPEANLGGQLVAGSWVASSLVFVYRRRWLGVISSVFYSVLSLIVSVTQIASGADLAWNIITSAGSLGIIIALGLAVGRRDFHHSRW